MTTSSAQDAALRQRRVLLALLAVYLIWGGSYATARIGVHHVPPFLFGGLRFMTAGVLLCAISWGLGNRPRLNWLELRHMWWVGFAGVVISNGANVWSLQYLASSQSALLNATGALWIAALSAFGPRAHALDRPTVIGLLLGFAGTAAVVSGAAQPGATDGHFALLPEVVTLVGVFGWAVATAYMRNYPSRLDLMTFTGGQMLIGGLVVTAIGLALGEGPNLHWSTEGLATMLYMIVLSSLIGYTAYAWLAKNSTPAVVGSYSYVVPALSALLGWWLLDEHLSAAQLTGMVVMLAGVALSSWPRDSSAAATNEGHGA